MISISKKLKMKSTFFILLISCMFFSSCDKKLTKKELKNGDITINWYFYSDITTNSDDFVEITHDDSTILIMQSRYTLQDIEIVSDTIVLSHLEFVPERIKVLKKGKVFGYFLRYKEVTLEEIR